MARKKASRRTTGRDDYVPARAAGLSRKDALIVGSVIEQLPKKTPAALVNLSRPKASPTHHLFEWDDTKAAEAHRRAQAAGLIRAIEFDIVVREKPERVRAFFSFKSSETKKPEYVSLHRVKTDKTLRDQIQTEALQQLRLWSRKYAILRAYLSGVFAEIDKLNEELE